MVDLPGPASLRRAPPPHRPPAKPAGTLAPPKGGSEVEGKSLPQLVSLANELASGPPPLDYARIAQIRAAISTGSYRPDPDRIAHALLGKLS
jgi:negative regulator of flagellin synthesis FlgM